MSVHAADAFFVALNPSVHDLKAQSPITHF